MKNPISEQELFASWEQKYFPNCFTDMYNNHRQELFLSTLTGGDMENPKHPLEKVLAILREQVRKNNESAKNYGFFRANSPAATLSQEIGYPLRHFYRKGSRG